MNRNPRWPRLNYGSLLPVVLVCAARYWPAYSPARALVR